MNKAPIYVGIDGEGVDYGGSRQDHRYTLLAACTEPSPYARQWYVENPSGLTTVECLNFLLELPRKRLRLFAYSFNYDLTKIFTDLDDARLYLLFRPELRQSKRKHGKPIPIQWQGFEINLQGTRLTLSRTGDDRVDIWDVWKFYQSPFVTALEDWKVGTAEELTRMKEMKAKRNAFAQESAYDIRKYCFSECANLAGLVHKLDDAHEAALLKLTSYYGCGSTATAMLKKMGIREKIRGAPESMVEGVAAAFFGGRFEHSVIGSIDVPTDNWDISSAYPYQLCFLPCLEHGYWTHTRKLGDIHRGRHALVRYSLRADTLCDYWAPFPFREADGSICFPSVSGGGWIWRDEFLEGLAGWPNLINFHEAWILDSDCDCQPFADIAYYYNERCRIGKEGPGRVFKSGPNSSYGKLAQSVGSAPFNSWIWAGMITSGCRAQLLKKICLVPDRSKVLMTATDGLYTTHSLCKAEKHSYPCDCLSPKPRDTGTNATGKPLGGWEKTHYKNGVFAARPGIYFPLNPTDDDIQKVRARGIGKGTLLKQWKAIIEKYGEIAETGNLELGEFHIQDVDRFCGAKTSIGYRESDKEFTRAQPGRLSDLGAYLPAYGQWITRPVQMSFNPMPKREGLIPGSKTHLKLRRLPEKLTSTPYKKSLLSREAEELIALQTELEEQPDVDWGVAEDIHHD